MNWSGDSHDAYSVIIDSALGVLGAPPQGQRRISRTDQVAAGIPDATSRRRSIRSRSTRRAPRPARRCSTQHCAACHASDKTGARMPLAGIETDRGRIDTWNKEQRDRGQQGRDATWGSSARAWSRSRSTATTRRSSTASGLRAPYLHNGSVPTLRDLLEAAGGTSQGVLARLRPLRPANVGFVSSGQKAEEQGTPYDVTTKSGGNQGHEFGTKLPAGEKDALIEYLKTL